MRKQIYLLFAAMIIVAMAATLFVGCKKEKHEAQARPEKTEVQGLVEQIKAFQTLRESVRSGMKADGTMTVEEMRQILDLTANYEHSEHMTCSENTILDTLFLAMPPVNGDGNVTEIDVVATYETFEAELQQHMEKADDGRNLPSYFSILMPGKGEKSEECITVVFLRGEERKESKSDRNLCDGEGPFIENEDIWYWGNDLGRCKWDTINATSDATDMLTHHFGFVIPEEHQGDSYYIYNVVHVKYRPSNPDVYYGFSNYYLDEHMEDCADTWLYCRVSTQPVDQCLYWDELNCYWRSIDRNIVNPDAPLHYTLLPNYNLLVPYHCCYISWHRFQHYDEVGLYYQIHVANVTYCDVLWSETPLPPVD